MARLSVNTQVFNWTYFSLI